MSAAEPSASQDLRVAWLGHAFGHRADGLASYSAQVAGALQARGLEVYFHYAARDGNQVPVDPARAIAWPSWRFKTVTVAGPGFRARMRAWLRFRRPDVTHCSLSFTQADGWVAGEAARVDSATVATFHLPFGEGGGGRELVMRELHRYWVRRLGAYQRLIVFREEHRDRLSALGMDPARIEVLPNAVDVEAFSPGPSRLRQDRLAGARMVVGFAGRLDPEKGIRELLDGFQGAGLGASGRLLLAGRGALERQVQQAASRDPRVVYLGQLTSVGERTEFWRSVDVFCLPSSAEGLSLSLLEAMACGCAVAATPAGGVEALGQAGVALDPRRLAESVAARLGELAQDPELVRGKGLLARSEAARHHGVEAMLDRLLAIYRDCVEQRRQR